MALLLNNQWACGICRRQADGAAVGHDHRLLWFCDQCGVTRARGVFSMPKDFLHFEKKALEALRGELMEGDLVVPEAEVETFLQWLIDTYGEKIRAEIDSGQPPF